MSVATEYVNISATPGIAFVPSQVTVTPGAPVHLVVTQMADFNHTFTLSSVANYTFSSSNTSADLNTFFRLHPPLVNLSLGTTVGAQFSKDFTAPPPGRYEFVCLADSHFQSGMHGVMISATGGAATSSSTPIYLELGAGVGVVVVAILAVFLWRRRRKPASDTGPPT